MLDILRAMLMSDVWHDCVILRELHTPCAHRPRTVQSFDICVFMGTVFSPLPSSKAPGYGMVGCVGMLVTKSYLFLPIPVHCS